MNCAASFLQCLHFKPTKQKIMKPCISDLPYPILCHILSFVPIISILTCKLVCKQWCSIIQDPQFSTSSKSITMVLRCTRDLHLVEPELDYSYDVGCVMLGRKAVIKLREGMVDGKPFKFYELVNSCKGLVCLASSFWSFVPYVVYDPVTSDYVVVKNLFPERMASCCFHKHAGLGFCSKSGKYKVIRFFDDWTKKDDDGFCVEADVCTLGQSDGVEEWRHLENRPPQAYWYGKGVFVEGAIHWIISNKKRTAGSIVAFVCEEENFVLMDFPVLFSQGFLWTPKELAVLRSQLCFCTSNMNDRDEYNIWVMNEYGIKESWRKLFVISSGESDSINRLMPFKPLAYLNSGEILMISVCMNLVSYDVTSNKWRAIKIPGVTTESTMVEAMLIDPTFLPTKNLLLQENCPTQT